MGPAAPGLRLHKNNQITSKRAVVVDIRLELPCHCQEQQLNNEARDNQLRSIFIPTNRRPPHPAAHYNYNCPLSPLTTQVFASCLDSAPLG